MYETRIRHLENVHAELDNRVDAMEKTMFSKTDSYQNLRNGDLLC